MEHRVHSVPSALREHYVLTDGFAAHLKQRGWRLSSHRPIYTDPQVIRQQWLLTPSGRTYSDLEFYYLFGEWNFRALLRTLLTLLFCIWFQQPNLNPFSGSALSW